MDLEKIKYFVSTLLPEEISKECLRIFAKGIEKASELNEKNWGVTVLEKENKIRLVVGDWVLCTLYNGRVWLVLDETLFKESMDEGTLEEIGLERDRDEKPYALKREHLFYYYTPGKKHTEVWPVLQKAFDSMIDYCSHQRDNLKWNSQEAFSPEMVDYLNEELGLKLGYPGYFDTDGETFERAVITLKSFLPIFQKDEHILSVIEARESVIERYQEVFAPANIPKLTREEFQGFLSMKNNHHWDKLERSKNDICRDMDLLKSSMTTFANQGLSIEERYMALAQIPGMGKAIITPLFLISDPKKYGVWNKPSQEMLNHLNLWPVFERGLSDGKKYEEINQVIIGLGQKLEMELWDLDALFWFINTSLKEGKASPSPGNEETSSEGHSAPSSQEPEGSTGSSSDEQTRRGAFSYWWLTANPHMWDPRNHKVGELQSYTSVNDGGNQRRIYKNFTEVKPGDRILIYISSPVREICGIAEATSGLRALEREGGQEGFEFKLMEHCKSGVTLKDIMAVEPLSNSEPLKNNCRGSLFRLSEEEFEILLEMVREKGIEEEPDSKPYDKKKAMEDLFFSEDLFDDILHLLKTKKSIILQGPPGVGKTYAAKKIAYAMMGEKNDSRIAMVQFHQSYSYEDFIQGIRPNAKGTFTVQEGVFYNFCVKKAQFDPDKDYFFIIDEINRGNLSRILGEVMVLLEADKRGTEVTLTYSENGDKFSIPPNLYLIGTMNTADRSLAFVDYALRRRFSFVNIPSALDKEGDHESKFLSFMKEKKVSEGLCKRIIKGIREINREICEDTKNLGRDFQLGHSYFCSPPEVNHEEWYRRVIRYEILPMLQEYWFDDLEKVSRFKDHLLEK